LAQVIIDRVLERGRLLRLDGPSVRTLHVNLGEALNEGSDQGDEVIRISGSQRSKFPEPTRLGQYDPKQPISPPELRTADCAFQGVQLLKADPIRVISRAHHMDSVSPPDARVCRNTID
jgi:hypothetical protein